jgi:hypothetical protein
MNQSKILEPLGCIPHTLFRPVTSHYPVTATAYGLNDCGSNAVKRSVAHGLEDSGLGCMIFSTPNRDCIEGQMSLHMTVAKSRLSRYVCDQCNIQNMLAANLLGVEWPVKNVFRPEPQYGVPAPHFFHTLAVTTCPSHWLASCATQPTYSRHEIYMHVGVHPSTASHIQLDSFRGLLHLSDCSFIQDCNFVRWSIHQFVFICWG